MILIKRATKDNTITNAKINGTNLSSSNQGKSEILDLFYISQNTSLASNGKSRILMQFDISSFSSSIASGLLPSSSVEYRLKLVSSPHYESVPQSFDIEVMPLSRSWDEGRGLSNFDEGLKDSGFSNWGSANSTTPWTIPGSDYLTSISASQHFDEGYENLDVDISNIVYAWLTGGIPNNGLVIKLPASQETGSQDYYVKKFFSRHALVPDRLPRIEARWTNYIHDDRSNVKYNTFANLYYYRSINGEFSNVGSTVFVDILNSSSTVVQTLTASIKETGIYEASGVNVAFTSSTQIYRDVWFTNSQQLFTGSFAPTFATGSNFFDFSRIKVDIPNLKDQYLNNEICNIRVFCREYDYKPALRKSGSVDPSPEPLKDAYYEIVNYENEQPIVSFSTGSIKYSKLSYDKNGNYFNLDTSNLEKGNVYKIKILVNYNKQQTVFDDGWLINVI